MNFYDAYRKSGQPPLTQVSDLVPAMLGTPEARVLKTKGAETLGVLLLVEQMLGKHMQVLGPTAP
eukprot:13065904-Alexandrium_andersonii.AAC.1